ncbi:hypothetical protein KKF84_12680 [Myxococcota bacterium]|nr:hypothetical protein [Myxococcota bacterium]
MKSGKSIVRCVFFILLLAFTGILSPFRVQAAGRTVFINPGVKLTYTFGEGFTYGFELSINLLPEGWDEMKEEPYGYGIAFNVDTTFKGLTKMRLGLQWIGPFIGVEAGPTFIRDHGRSYFGMGYSFWGGLWVIPTYTYTNGFGSGKSYHEIGSYFKLHLIPGSSYGGDGEHHDWFDDK